MKVNDESVAAFTAWWNTQRPTADTASRFNLASTGFDAGWKAAFAYINRFDGQFHACGGHGYTL